MDFYVLEPSAAEKKLLLEPPVFKGAGDNASTNIIQLLSKRNVAGHTGVGSALVNIDGYRMINAYVISDPLNSTTQRGFSLELSFSLAPFVYGTGVVGETSFFFNFDSYFDGANVEHRPLQSQISDHAMIQRIGGVDKTNILRIPVLGPYVRASVFNEDGTARNVEVKAYLTT